MKQWGLAICNPVKEIPIKKGKSLKVYLELNKVESSSKLYESGKLSSREQNVLQYFLFACYTGLRFGDVEQFNTDMIVYNKISIVAEKTNVTVLIPVIEQAKELLLYSNKQFRVIRNQKSNDSLKIIMDKAKIKKNVSFHCARHTFAQ